MIIQFRFRRGTATEWQTTNPVLVDGEPGWDTTTGGFKVGDGVTAWNDLLYQSYSTQINAPVMDISDTESLGDAGDPINVTGKFLGKPVYNTATSMPVYATGSTPGATWNDATGVIAHTPI